MASLTRYGAEVGSAFSLLGQDENDLTAALGFTLARCKALSDAILSRVWPGLGVDEDASFALEVRAEIGRTDLEVRLPASSALLIFEAKRDWLLPTTAQLEQYVSRIHQYGSGALVSLSQASTQLATTQRRQKSRASLSCTCHGAMSSPIFLEPAHCAAGANVFGLKSYTPT